MRSLTRMLPCATWLIALLLVPLPTQAQAAQTAEAADQFLGALAEVLKDRAKQVAADILMGSLEKTLCRGKTPVTYRNGQGALELNFGGKKADTNYCTPDEVEGDCTADSVYIRSCALLRGQDMSLTDPVLLKTIAADTVSLLFRVGTANVNAVEYRKSGVEALSTFATQLLFALANKELDKAHLVDALDALEAALPLEADESHRRTTIREVVQIAGIVARWRPTAQSNNAVQAWFDAVARFYAGCGGSEPKCDSSGDATNLCTAADPADLPLLKALTDDWLRLAKVSAPRDGNGRALADTCRDFRELFEVFRDFHDGPRDGRSIVSLVAQVMKWVAKRDGARPEGRDKALKLAIEVLGGASSSGWKGVAMALTDAIFASGGEPDEFRNLMSIIRTLTAVYDAKDREEAKAVLSAALEDRASRHRRYKFRTVDVTAVLGAGAGGESLRERGEKGTWEDAAASYGLVAPVGVQYGSGWLGVLVYPVDIGAYLTGRDSSATPSWRVEDALRIGVAPYCRVSDRIPIDLGLRVDWKPSMSRGHAFRYGAIVGLELPLFTLL